MNERIKQLAVDAGYEKDMFGVGHWDMPEFKKFTALVEAAARADEREECAKLCETKHFSSPVRAFGAKDCADAIRERGTT